MPNKLFLIINNENTKYKNMRCDKEEFKGRHTDLNDCIRQKD